MKHATLAQILEWDREVYEEVEELVKVSKHLTTFKAEVDARIETLSETYIRLGEYQDAKLDELDVAA